MTTIAFRDGIFAADTQLTYGKISVGRVEKISVIGKYVLAFSGEFWCRKLLEDWLEHHDADPEHFPKKLEPAGDDSALFDAMIWHKGDLYEISQGHLIQSDAEYFAAGSGWQLALGAMATGATALQAVRAAAEHCLQTSAPFTTYNSNTGVLTYEII